MDAFVPSMSIAKRPVLLTSCWPDMVAEKTRHGGLAASWQ